LIHQVGQLDFRLSKRFDFDKDGVLDATEKKFAAEQLARLNLRNQVTHQYPLNDTSSQPLRSHL
jgi:hypothetical protein